MSESQEPVETAAVPGDLEVAEGHGAGVGDVVGLGEAVEAQLGLDGVLHLLLGGLAAAGQRLLDPGGGVAEDRDPALRRRPGRSPRGRGPSGSPSAGA